MKKSSSSTSIRGFGFFIVSLVIVLVLAACGGDEDDTVVGPDGDTRPPPAAGADVEPNDLISQANSIAVPSTQSGGLSLSDLQDYYRFVADRTGTVAVQVSDFRDLDLDLFAWNSAGEEIALSASPNDPTERVTVPVGVGNTYYVTVFNFSGSTGDTGSSSYQLSLQYTDSNEQPPQQPPEQPPQNPPAQNSLTFELTDGCNDGFRINYRFYDTANDLVWPSANQYYFTRSFGTTYTHELSCAPNAVVCYGASTGPISWGVGLDKTQSCTDCCYRCNGATARRNLVCN